MERRLKIQLAIGVGVIALAIIAAAVWVNRTELLALIPTPPIVITDVDQGKTINLLQGERLEVRLKANRLARAHWRQGGIPLPLLKQIGATTFTEDNPAAHPGDGVESTLFIAVATGPGPFFMNYVPDDNQNSFMPTKTFHVTLIVR